MPDWAAGDRATRDAYANVETLEEKLDELLGNVRDLGFQAVDVWEAHLDPETATDRHIETAVRLLRRHDLRVASLAGWFGSTRERFAAACRLAATIGAPVLGGSTSLVEQDRSFVLGELERHGLRLGLENHPETPDQMLARIGDGGEGLIGTTVDTGWYATQGFDAAAAIERLAPHVMHVHLKDVLHAGPPHRTCAFGAGVVPLRECVAALRRIGYRGAISVEHEPEDHDPRPEIRVAREQLGQWLEELDAT